MIIPPDQPPVAMTEASYPDTSGCAPHATRSSETGDSTPWSDGLSANDVGAALLGIAVAALMLPSIDACFAMPWWLLVMVIIRSDVTSLTIPDEASLAIAALGFGYRISQQLAVDATWAEAIDDAASSTAMASLGAGLGFWIIGFGFRCWRGYDGLGFGDVKLAAASAIWLDLGQQAIALNLATLAAVATVGVAHWRNGLLRDDHVPFGAFLAPAAWMVFVAAALLPDGIGQSP